LRAAEPWQTHSPVTCSVLGQYASGLYVDPGAPRHMAETPAAGQWMVLMLFVSMVRPIRKLSPHARCPTGRDLHHYPNDFMTSLYVRTPSDVLVEYGWGGCDVADANWQPR